MGRDGRGRRGPMSSGAVLRQSPDTTDEIALNKGAATVSLARVQNFSVSLDGFGTGEGQSFDAPFGHAGQRLHEWMSVSAEVPRRSGTFLRRGWATTRTSAWSRSCSAEAYACGTSWKASRRATTSRPSPHRAE